MSLGFSAPNVPMLAFEDPGAFMPGNIHSYLPLMSRNARSRENGQFDKILLFFLAKAANVVNLEKLAMQWRKWQI